ncbi:MAG: Ig-like domain-containing protein [Clostridiales bacterium]|nr:Ig-like domain-containing protein [Clostridiales bacterium]
MLKEIGKQTVDWTIKNAPTILTAVGAAGVVLTAVAAGKASIKAKKVLEEMPEDADVKEKAKVVAPIMAKPFLLGLATIGCIFYANHEHLKREAALAAVYSLSSKALEEYEAKVIDTVGETKNKKIKDAIAEDSVAKNPPPQPIIIQSEGTRIPCQDWWTGQWFVSDIETIRTIEDDINDELKADDDFVPINYYYDRIGMELPGDGENIGWRKDSDNDERFKFEYSSVLHDNIPTLVVRFSMEPKDYYYD